MSLIEDALNKAEKEKEWENGTSSPTLSVETPTLLNRKEKRPSRIIVFILSLACIVGSATWLAFWWVRHPKKLSPPPLSVATKSKTHPIAIAQPAISPAGTKNEIPSGQSLPAPSSFSQRPVSDPAIEPAHPAPVSQELPTKGKPPRVSPASTQKKPFLRPPAKPSKKNSTGHFASSKNGSPNKTRPKTKKVLKQHPTKSPPSTVQNPHPLRSKTSPEKEQLSIQLAKKAIRKGLRAYRKGDLQTAARALEKSMDYADPTFETLKFLGEIHLELGNYDKAAPFIQQALSMKPSDPALLEKKGLIFMEKEEYAEAIRHFLKSIKKSPYRYSPHVNLGIAYWKIGNLLAAKEEFQTAIRIQKDRYEAYLNLVGVEEAMGEFARAINTLETLLKISHRMDETARKEAQNHLEALKNYIKKEGKQ